MMAHDPTPKIARKRGAPTMKAPNRVDRPNTIYGKFG
jgi:hypothetical protein